jgi:hypothetical protein
MDAGEEDGVARAEEVVGAVAMMDVPVEDEDPSGVERVERVLRRHRDVVEQTEPRRRCAARVVTGRARPAEGCASLAGDESVRRRARAARGVQRGAVGTWADHRLVVQAAAAGTPRAHLLDVSLSVHGGHGIERRRGRFTTLVPEPAAPLELGLDRVDARGALGMLAGLVLEARGVREVEGRSHDAPLPF